MTILIRADRCIQQTVTAVVNSLHSKILIKLNPNFIQKAQFIIRITKLKKEAIVKINATALSLKTNYRITAAATVALGISAIVSLYVTFRVSSWALRKLRQPDLPNSDTNLRA